MSGRPYRFDGQVVSGFGAFASDLGNLGTVLFEHFNTGRPYATACPAEGFKCYFYAAHAVSGFEAADASHRFDSRLEDFLHAEGIAGDASLPELSTR